MGKRVNRLTVTMYSDEFVGTVTGEFGRRRSIVKEMTPNGRGDTRIVLEISERNLLGTHRIAHRYSWNVQMSAMFVSDQ